MAREPWSLSGKAEAADSDHVRISVDTYCGSLCGDGTTYYLERQTGLWRVARNEMEWVSEAENSRSSRGSASVSLVRQPLLPRASGGLDSGWLVP